MNEDNTNKQQSRGFKKDGIIYFFSFSKRDGIIRERYLNNYLHHPEIYNGKRWVYGDKYVLDAVTGRSDDVWSCGSYCDDWTFEQAQQYALTYSIDLFGPLEP